MPRRELAEEDEFAVAEDSGDEFYDADLDSSAARAQKARASRELREPQAPREARLRDAPSRRSAAAAGARVVTTGTAGTSGRDVRGAAPSTSRIGAAAAAAGTARSTQRGLVDNPDPSQARRHDSQLLANQAKTRADRISKLSLADINQTDEEMRKDIEVARHALHLFLNSRMMDAYELIEVHSERRMYYATAYALLSTIKAVMTYEHQDLGTAISHCKDALHIANLLRKKTSRFTSISRFVRGAGPSVAGLASMTQLQKHAELISAECSLLKAVLGIAYSGDLLGSLSEALHLRAAYGDYKSLLQYVEWEDKNNARETDEDFRSGVYLGSGCISLILGLLPARVLKVMEVFGYEGSVSVGLDLLARASGWSKAPEDHLPAHTAKTEGVRSPVCDMTMLCYHLVISTFIPVPHVDIDFAEKVLDYHLQRYPMGVFFLYFHGRLYSTQALSKRALERFRQARDVQGEYVQLKHICYWDMSLCHLSLNDWQSAYESFSVLAAENNWSKALYNYGRAAALYQTGDADKMDEAREIMERVPSMSQKIAGKSIPLEKFAARKARKMTAQGRLLLPAMELAYLTHCYTTAPPRALQRRSLPTVEKELRRLEGTQQPNMDDLCLAHFLRGVILRNLVFPERHVKLDPDVHIDQRALAAQAEKSLQFVADHGAECDYDHYLLYFCHYELGRLYISMGRTEDAKHELELIMSGKNLGDHNRKGKYSMQNMCVLRSHGALETLDAGHL